MRNGIKHPALTVIVILIVASCLYGFTKLGSRANQEAALSVARIASAEHNATSGEINQEYAMDYALATGGWIAPRTH